MEPSIYKPSIYKGAGIYNNGAGGGGGGGDTVEIGGKKYLTAKIGNQIWTAQNLDFLFSGVALNPGGEPTTPAAFVKNINTRCAYGLLYNWYAVNLLQTNKDSLIPGWHLPTKSDFETLFSEIGGINNALKLCYTPWNGGSDEYGFTLKPGGQYNNGIYNEGGDGILWSQTQYNANEAYFFIVQSNVPNFAYYYKKYGYAVRLIKD